METVERTRFNEEIFDLLAKYGYKGMIGIVIDGEHTPSVTQFVQPGETSAYYGIFYTAICKMVELISGTGITEEVTTLYTPKPGNTNNEMPH